MEATLDNAATGTGRRGAPRANVLIVDDRPEKRLVLKAILEDLGQNIVTVASGEQALKQVLQQDFAVILLDVNMPGLDGLETAALIRSRKRSAHIPIIFITADYNDEMHSAKGYALGAVDYIASPVVPEILRSKVRVFVDLYLLAQQIRRQAQEHMALADERAARAAAEQANRRSAFLASASAALGSLDPDSTARELVRVAVPFLADVAALAPPAGEGADTRLYIAWDHDGGAPMQSQLWQLESRGLNEAIERVRRSGVAQSLDEPALQDILHGFDGPMAANPFGAPVCFALDALLLVPLAVGDRSLGVLLLGMGPTHRRFDAEALAVATDLAARGATALENARLYRKIQDADHRKNEFLAMLAHELRNPLAPISNALHVLQADEVDAQRLNWAKEVIGRQLKQLVRLVDDLLDVSRITRGKIQLKMEAVDVSRVVAAAIETSHPFIDAQHHRVTILVAPQAVAVRGDFLRVSQILANLITNAAKYTEREGHIEIAATREDGDVVFRVRDTGVGISKESLATIFDLFTQVDGTLDRSRGGLGIGLTLVRRLVELQGGTVQAYSAGKDQGSEFTVRLPAANERPTAPVATPVPVTSPGVRVLVVDDNQDVAESTAMLLRMAGCEVHVAFDGAVALESLTRVRPDAVLLDIGLPGMNGYELAAHIRADPLHARTLLVAVSGYGQEDHRQRSKSAGFDYHMVKPVDPAVIMQLLAALPPAPASDRRAASVVVAGPV